MVDRRAVAERRPPSRSQFRLSTFQQPRGSLTRVGGKAGRQSKAHDDTSSRRTRLEIGGTVLTDNSMNIQGLDRSAGFSPSAQCLCELLRVWEVDFTCYRILGSSARKLLNYHRWVTASNPNTMDQVSRDDHRVRSTENTSRMITHYRPVEALFCPCSRRVPSMSVLRRRQSWRIRERHRQRQRHRKRRRRRRRERGNKNRSVQIVTARGGQDSSQGLNEPKSST